MEIKPPVIPKNTKVPTTLLSFIRVKLVNSNKGIEHFWSSTFGSFWIQNFLVDFCLFLHLWQKYNSVSSSSSRSVKLCKQSKQKPIEYKMQSFNQAVHNQILMLPKMSNESDSGRLTTQGACWPWLLFLTFLLSELAGNVQRQI